jgi:ubiquinol-cytochrome c reductase cytochrome c1 subunit
MMKTTLTRCLRYALALLLFAPWAAYSSGDGARLQPAPINGQDLTSLQNGAKIFVNYCLNCHSANYMRYNRLQDLGLSEAQIRDNLIFTGVKVGELMQVGMVKKEAAEWFGTAPPDLTVVARSRSSGAGSGADWLYTYLRAFYRDSSRPTGWNNLVYENVAMPHVLWQLSGQADLVTQQFDSHHEAQAALIAAKTVARLDKAEAKGAERYMLKTLQVRNPGSVAAGEYDKTVADLVNYMVYMAEPVRNERRQIGIYVLLFLGILFIFAFLLKRAYWKDVH